MNEKKSLSVKEFAAMVEIHLFTGHLQIWKGRIGAKINTEYRVIDRAEAVRFLKERSAKRARKNGQAVEHQKNWNFDDIFKLIRLLTIIAVSLIFVVHENSGIEKWLEFMSMLISI